MRKEEELTKRVFLQQKKNPTAGDFVELMKDDFIKMGKHYDDKMEDYVV